MLAIKTIDGIKKNLTQRDLAKIERHLRQRWPKVQAELAVIEQMKRIPSHLWQLEITV